MNSSQAMYVMDSAKGVETMARALASPDVIRVRASEVEVATIEYEMSHGKLPRGRGSWAFAATRNPKIEDVFWPQSYDRVTGRHTTYATQAKLAREHFANLGFYTIYAQP